MDSVSPPTNVSRVAFIGNYLPRKCGIATFTHDLCEAVSALPESPNCFALPVTDEGKHYDYPERVRFHIAEKELPSYGQAADYLNVLDVDVVSLQHEFGIFGGPDGNHILNLLRELHMPVVTTMHTVVREPSDSLRKTTLELVSLSDRIVVMAERGHEFLTGIYGVDSRKIDVIPHGIPDMPFVDPNFFKYKYGVSGRLTLLTFGLLSPNKGIENVIRALPEVVERHPDVVYVVLGVTHPNLVRQEGEQYRMGLQRLAASLGVADHVIFHDRFVGLEELKEFIGASDIYITPYLNEAQITSGTLAYAFGAGKAVISTPYWHAKELLADDRGVLVPFADSEAMAAGLNGLIEDEDRRHAMRRAAYEEGRKMIWERVAEEYLRSFRKARDGDHPASAPRADTGARSDSAVRRRWPLPDQKIDHLDRMTDSVGLWQHARFCVPNFEDGYCTDDNARALLLFTMLEQCGGLPAGKVQEMAAVYLGFLNSAFNPDKGRFRNFLSPGRQWLEEAGSEDSHGRALWALGYCVGHTEDQGFRSLAASLFVKGAPTARDFTSPRAWAYTLLGIEAYLSRFPGDVSVETIRDSLADRLMGIYRAVSSADWTWFEDCLAYANARLPHALLVTGRASEKPDLIEAGIDALCWLMRVQTGETGCFSPIGSDEVYRRGGRRHYFDQQPIEAQASVSACLEAWRITGEEKWYHEARRAFDWFLGENDMGLPLYDDSRGGCRDGLHVDRVNENQGADSTLAFHLALAEKRLAQHDLGDTSGGENLASEAVLRA